MSSSSPEDLAVAFRSVTRRLREAQGDAPAELTAEPSGRLDRQLAAAGTLLHVTPAPDALAAAIEAIPADAWDESTLDGLRAIALEVGRLLRQIGSLTEPG
jgi:hypothetical protein